MKKFLPLFLAVVTTFLLSSCDKNEEQNNDFVQNTTDYMHTSIYTTAESTQANSNIFIANNAEHSTINITQNIESGYNEETTQYIETFSNSYMDTNNPVITTSTTNVKLSSFSEVVYITVAGLNEWSTTYDVANENIVYCEWGEWNGEICPLTITPIQNGNTFVTVFLDGYNKYVTINVSVENNYKENNYVENTTTEAPFKFETSHIHNYSQTIVNPTCLEQGWTIYRCYCGTTYNDNYVPKIGHTIVIDSAVPATPTSTGLTEGKHCSVCNTVIVSQQIIPKDNGSLVENTTFSLTNSLSEEYSYVASILYSKCKIEKIDCEVLPYPIDGKIQLKIKVLMKKTYQGDTNLDNIKFNYTLYRDGIAVKNGDVIVTHAELDTVYEKTIIHIDEPGNYTMSCK